MSDSARQLLVDRIVTRLKSIAPGVVFQLPDGPHTCSETIKDVYPWRKAEFSPAEVPAIRLQDGDASTKPGPSTKHEHDLDITLDLVTLGKVSASQVRTMMADVVAAIGSDPRWGGLAWWTEINGHELDVEQAGNTIAAAQIRLTVKYRTPLWRM
jgi:hypothetical protein